MKNNNKKLLLAIGGVTILTIASVFFTPSKTHQMSPQQPKPTQNLEPKEPVTQPTSTNQGDSPQPDITQSDTETKNQKATAGTIITTNKPEDVLKFAEQNNLVVNRVIPVAGGKSSVVISASMNSPEVSTLKQLPYVETTSQNFTYRALYSFTNQDTNYSGQWNLSKIAADTAWDITTGSSDTTIAIIDTGVLFNQTINGSTYSQPDFPASKLWTNIHETGTASTEGPTPNCTSRGLPIDKQCNNIDDDTNGQVDDWQGWDFMGGFSGNTINCPNYSAGLPADYYIDQDNDPQPYSCDSPTFPSELNKTHYNNTCEFGVSACFISHGTSVASVAAASSNNGQLVAGIDHSAKIMNLRALDGYGYTTTDRVAEAVLYAARNRADVINMSLAVSDCSNDFVDPLLEAAMAEAKAAGVVIVAASGNEYLSTVCYPASSEHAIAVGATDENDKKADFSNFGNKLDVVAPGVNIPAANAPSNANNSTYTTASGTSLATPHVAGLAGLVKAAKPTASAADIKNIITERADIVTGMNGSLFTFEYGYGRINSYTSTRVAEGLSRPIYHLYNGSCYLYTSSVHQRNYVEKIKYVFQAIDSWQTLDNTLTYQPIATNHVCSY